MTSRTAVGAAMACIAATVPVGEAGAKTKPQLKLITGKTVTSQVSRPGAFGDVFQQSAYVRASCGANYRALSLGIASATHPLAAQDLGFYGGSVYVSGAEGTAKTRLQVLCVRGREPSYKGQSVKLSATGAGMALTATVTCRANEVALGAALAHGHAPAYGAYTSRPDGTRRWTYIAQIPSSLAAQLGERASQAGYPHVACVRATGVTTVEFRGVVAPDRKAQGTATCKRGRVLGWGVELAQHRTLPGGSGAWAIPTIERAQFTSTRSMAFRFARDADAGADTNPTAVRATVICGTLA